MRLGIFGGSGTLGSVLLPLCLERGINVVAPSHQQVDISNLEALDRFVKEHGLTHVINCAAYTNVDEAENHPEMVFRMNAAGPECLGKVAARHRLKVVHVSTDYVFDGKGSVPYLETDSCAPVNVYGTSKWEGELRLLKEYPHACIVRCSWLFGRGSKNFISSLLGFMQKQEEVRVVASQKGRPTFCRDMAEACLALLDKSGVFHFANEGEVSRYDMAQEILKQALAQNMPLVCRGVVAASANEFPTRATRPVYSVLGTKKIEALVKIRPWQQALDEYLAEYLTQ